VASLADRYTKAIAQLASDKFTERARGIGRDWTGEQLASAITDAATRLPSSLRGPEPPRTGGRRRPSWKIAEQVNPLRGLQGSGHGRTLPTGVSADLALLVVREACSVAEYALVQLDRQRGH
jgi:hypothetical protein